MPHNRHKVRFGTALFMLTMSVFSNLNAKWQAALTIDEQQMISAHAKQHHQTTEQTTQQPDQRLFADRKNDTNTVTSTLGLEILMVELQEKKSRKPADARIAEVYLFDYATDTASVQLINADTNELIRASRIDQIHLPLNQNEQALSVQLMLSNTELMDTLNNEHIKQFGSPLHSLNQLDMKLSIWRPGPNDTNALFCENTRCALASIFTDSFYNFSIEPVIDLKQAVVHLDLVR